MEAQDQQMVRPLEGMRVLDFAPGGLAQIGRNLAELGADVVRLEFTGEGQDRTAAPAVAGMSLDFAAANLGKRGAVIDLAAPDTPRLLDDLCARADLLIEAARPGSPQWRAIDPERRRAAGNKLVILSIPDFAPGRFGSWKATDPVLHALCGTLARSGLPGREPLLPPGELAIRCAADQLTYIALLSYYHRLLTDEGDHVTVPLIEAALPTIDPGYGMSGSAAGATLASQLPRGRPDYGRRYPIVPCADGFVRLAILSPRQWRALFDWVGRPAEFADPRFEMTEARFTSTTLLPFLATRFSASTAAQLEQEGQSRGIPIAAVLSLDEALSNEHAETRGAIAAVRLAAGVETDFPNGVIEVDGVRMGLRGPPPAPGGSLDAVLDAWSEPRPGAPPPSPPAVPGKPLSGLRVLDLGVIVVGGEQGRLLADFGAEVIKIEHSAYPDGSRRAGIFTASFASGHRNKKSVGLDLRSPAGRGVFLDLVRQSDVILSNFKPGTFASLGLSFETLLAANPRLIVVDSSAYGASGPWRGRMGYGPLLRAGAGLTKLWSYPDDENAFCDSITVYPDHVAARIGVFGAIALLIRRLSTGAGGRVSISQTEVILNHLGRLIAERGLRLRGLAASQAERPWPPFPCAGDDEWCVVSVRDEAEVAALAAAIGADNDAWAGDRPQLESRLRAWLRDRTACEAMYLLQDAGVPAGAMLRVGELPDFPYFQEAGVFQLLAQPQLAEPVIIDNLPLRSARLERPPIRPAPTHGEDTFETLGAVLGLADDDLDRLLAEHVLETSEPVAAGRSD